MNIYTSYFANLKNIDSSIVPISISLYPPKWYEGAIYKKPAPTYEILNDWKKGKQDEEAKGHYERMYQFSVLRKLNANEVLKDLEEISNGKDVCLLCFEKRGDFCHRHLFAKFLEDSLGIEIKEL